jgi:cytochrome b pre-mRNA-processing protein 3
VAGFLQVIGLRRPRRHAGAARGLYNAAVTAAREPWFYRVLGVPDTLDGRFDLIALHAFLVIHRLQDAPDQGPALAQAVFDAMFRDMDDNLREIGVSDLSVGKRMRAMWEALHGRANAYAAALKSPDGSALEHALARNVWRDSPPPGAAGSLARLVTAQSHHLARQDLAALASGKADFLPPQAAAR